MSPIAADERAEPQIVLHRQRREHLAAFRHLGDALATRRCAGSRSIASPPRRIVPDRIGCTPEIARSSVVLPAPFDPTSATISPASTLSDTPCSTSMRP